MQIFTKLLLTFYLSLFSIQSFSQETGQPFIRNYGSNEYSAAQQNWAIAQDKRGILYFGNNNGLLEFDGVSWRLNKMTGVRSILVDSLDRVYLGLENDLGYMEQDGRGNSRFVSLKSKIPARYREFMVMRQIFKYGKSIIFQASNTTFLYQDDTIKVLLNQQGIYARSFAENNTLYLFDDAKGFYEVTDQGPRFIESSEFFVNKLFKFEFPYGKGDMLIFTFTDGIYRYSPLAAKKFTKPPEFREVDDFLTRNMAYCGIRLPGGDYAVGTIKAGILVFDQHGRIRNNYYKGNGLQDNTIYYLFTDRQQQLWAALDNGISMVQDNLSFRMFNEKNGIVGTPMSLANYKGQMVVGTSLGFSTSTRQGEFRPVPGTEGQGFDVLEAGGSLLMGVAPTGIFEYDGKTARLVPGSLNCSGLSFGSVRNHPEYVLAGTGNGILLLVHENYGWRVKCKVRGIDLNVYSILEDKNENLWITTNVDLFRGKLNSGMDSLVNFRKFSSREGLPSNLVFTIKLNTGEVIFSTEKGIYRYLEDKDRFVPHPDFPMIKGKAIPFKQLSDGTIWFEELVGDGFYEKGILTYRNGRYNDFRTPFYKFTDLSSGEVQSVYRDKDGKIYFGTNSGLMQYDPGIRPFEGRPFQTLIRKVISRDSLLFNGGVDSKPASAGDKSPHIAWRLNDIVFHYAATYFEDPEKNLYSYRLIGLDTAWSAWVSDNKKEYTNLREGNYTFEVRSKNQYQVHGSTASYSFRIMPPWYRTWWAYLLYVIIAVLAVYLLLHYRTRQLRKRSQELEETVKKRTEQIEELSRVGRDITSSLSIETIIHTVYQNVNKLMDASVFTIGIHVPEEKLLDFPTAIEKNQTLPPFTVSTDDENRLAAWCFNRQQDVVINDYALEYNKYVRKMSAPIEGENPESILYLPMWHKEKAIGVISAQSFHKNAYTDYHINILRNLATYCAIALENADAYRRLAALLDKLKATQSQLIQSEKMASLGELTAGIAHEIQNPLNFVNNFSEVSNELLKEMKIKLQKGNEEEALVLADEVKQNLEKINNHGKRADAIVKGMLLHSRSSSGVKEPTDINALADEYLSLSYHGLRAKDKAFNATMKTSFDDTLGKIDVIPQELGRAILNLITNAFYAVSEKKKLNIPGYEPMVSLFTKRSDHKVEIGVEDNGMGIPQTVIDKIFQPFFTTKPPGEGTGLGLSLSYDIITKMHGGELKVETKEGEYSVFKIFIPV